MKRSRSQDVFDEERLSSSDDSGENLMEGMEGDYAAIPELDHYDHSFLDRRDYDRIDIIARRAAEVNRYIYIQLENTYHDRLKSTLDI